MGVRAHLRSLALLAALPLLAGSLLLVTRRDPAEGAARFSVISKRTLMPGLVYTKLAGHDPDNRIYVLRIDPSQPLTLDVALANDYIPGHERTSSMAARHRAVAAINGDFTLLPNTFGAGRPVNAFAIDGKMIASPSIWGRNFALTRDETRAYLGHPQTSIKLIEEDSDKRWTISGWHQRERLTNNRIGAFAGIGGKPFRPPKKACAVRLKGAGPLRWASQRVAIDRSLEVVKERCDRRRMGRKGGIVVATPWRTKTAGALTRSLRVGDEVRVRWTLGWSSVLETIGGNPTLFENGKTTIGECDKRRSYFCARNPRTGIGWTAGGEILMVVVDGRSKGSKGMTLWELAGLFRYLGARSALNLDGGGSSTMVLDNRVVNRPTDPQGERPVGSALLVLEGPDLDEPKPLPPAGTTDPEPEPTPLPTPTPTEDPDPLPTLPVPLPAIDPNLVDTISWLGPGHRCTALSDPGSTAGLFDALDKGLLGAPRNALDGLGAGARETLDIYRGVVDC